VPTQVTRVLIEDTIYDRISIRVFNKKAIG
jgi:hypothetical protein